MDHFSIDYTIDYAAKQFAIEAHAGTNHLYDGKPYAETHLQMVVDNAEEFSHLVSPEQFRLPILPACWLHDTVEDCRITYNQIKEKFGIQVAEVVRACTNYGRGRNRDERMPDYIYAELRRLPEAIFVKLCDRLANIKYSAKTQSSMLAKYRKEQEKFEYELRWMHGYGESPFEAMFVRMNQYLNKK